jgi:hypothetical protein
MSQKMVKKPVDHVLQVFGPFFETFTSPVTSIFNSTIS